MWCSYRKRNQGRRHFVKKNSAKTSIMIPSPSYFWFKNTSISASTSVPVDIHLVRVPNYVDVVNVSEMRRTSCILFCPCWQLCSVFNDVKKAFRLISRYHVANQTRNEHYTLYEMIKARDVTGFWNVIKRRRSIQVKSSLTASDFLIHFMVM